MIKINDNSLHLNKPIPIKSSKTFNRNVVSRQKMELYSTNNIAKLSNNSFLLSDGLYKKQKKHQKKAIKKPELSDPRVAELELTPNAKTFIKTVLSPVASISYVLQEASVAFNNLVSASITFLIFNLLNVFLSTAFTAYEVKLPILTVCLIGCIFGARNLIKSTKKIVLSIPKGIKICYSNIFIEKCTIFDFICGKDKQPKKNIFKRMASKLSS